MLSYYLGVDELHDGLFEVVQVHGILRWCPSDHVVFVVIVPAKRSEFLCVGEFDVDTILLHDALNAPAPDANDTFMISFRYVE